MSGGFGRSWGSLQLWGRSLDCSSLVCQGTLLEFCLDSGTNRAKKEHFNVQKLCWPTGFKRSSYTAVYIEAPIIVVTVLVLVTVLFFFHKTKIQQ